MNFAIIERKDNTGDIFDDVLPNDTTEQQAINLAKEQWAGLSNYDKQHTTIQVAAVELDDDGFIDYGIGYTLVAVFDSNQNLKNSLRSWA